MYLLLIYILIPAVPLVIMPGYIRSGSISPYRTVLQAALITTASAAAVLMAASIMGDGLFGQLQVLAEDMAEQIGNAPMMADAFDMAAMDEADRVEMFRQLYEQAFAVLPACVMVMSAVFAYLEYIILSKIMARRRSVNMMPPFREFSLPGGAMMGIVGMYLAAWILTEAGVFSNNMMYMNIDFLFDFAFSIQGVSVVLMFCHMKRLPKILGAVAAVILWMTYIGKMFLVIIGMFDLMFNFKGRIQNTGRNIK